MTFIYNRTIRFQDTDAAGVVYFAQGLAICHEAYEASLAEAGISPQSFFRSGESIVPITHAEIDFFRPMQCGDQIEVILSGQPTDEYSFILFYQVRSQTTPDQLLAQAQTHHICLQTHPRRKISIPATLQQWLEQHPTGESAIP